MTPHKGRPMTSTALKRTTLAFGLALMAPLAAWSQVSISVGIAPPPLPYYAQPPIPGDGYIWTPGYWAWDAASNDYVWVPGTWVLPPGAGLLWTPGYWGFYNGGYGWHHGYWGPHVGYYGGINYGYGYIGNGYAGGRWDRGRFRYNTAVNNIPSGRVHDVYRSAVPERGGQRESFNGGNSHYRTPPTANERRFEGGQHPNWTQAQTDHERRSISMPEQRMGNNHGQPPTAATPRPGGFGDPQVEHVRQQPGMRAEPVRGGPGTARPEGNPGAGRPAGGNPGMARPEGNPGGGRPQGNPGGGHPGGGEHGGGGERGGGERR
jgi:hypothetical protein